MVQPLRVVLVASLLAGACSAGPDGAGVADGRGGSSAASGAGAGGVGGSGGSGGSTSAGGSSTGGTGGSLISTDAGGGSSGDGGSAGTGTIDGAAGGGACPGAIDTPVPEVCDNGLDDDLNGFIDESCACSLGATQPCFGGQPSEATLPHCMMGVQTCVGTAEFPGWGPCEGWGCGATPPPEEICDNGVDDDCDGQVDEGCDLEVEVNIDGDCVTASCPPQAPFPIACNITMSGGDHRGCIANSGGALVYFQEGDKCGAGHVGGTLLCSSQPPTAPLSESNCAINKSTKYYPPDPSGCPAT